VPVERFVGIGLVGPRLVRPASGVWARVSSRPVPPRFDALLAFRAGAAFFAAPRFAAVRFGAVRFAAAFLRAGATPFFAAFFSLPGRGGLVARFRAALPFGVRAPAVRREPPLLAAAARFPAPARLREGVLLGRLVVPLFFAIAVFSLRSAGQCSSLRLVDESP
jgi:hypothetical protein